MGLFFNREVERERKMTVTIERREKSLRQLRRLKICS